MRASSTIVVGLLLMLGACVPKAAPPPAARPAAPSRPAPAPAPPPRASADWRDWPLTPGDWRYAGGRASFGRGAGIVLSLACDAPGARVTLSIAGQGSSAVTVRTTSLSRTLAAVPGATTLDAALPAQDPLLDAIGFSRGRFIVERPGTPPLVVPAYAEILRVIEDCRG